MTTNELHRAIHRNPFVPFVIRTTGYREFRVPGRDFIMLAPGSRLTAIGMPDGTIEILDMPVIATLIFDDPPPDGP